MSGLQESLTRLALNPAYHDFFTLLKVNFSDQHPDQALAADILQPCSLGRPQWRRIRSQDQVRTTFLAAAAIAYRLTPLHPHPPSRRAHRFPHALVMTFLFGRGTPSEKLQFIFKATRMHSFNLMKFASLYKFLQIVLRRTNGGKARSLDSFIAGIVGGWVVFGERTAVNEQVSWRC